MGSNPGLIEGQVPTAAQWNSYFSKKMDDPGFTPLSLGGGTLTGPLFTCASTTATTGFNIAPGVAPTTPNTGDIWSTASGLFTSISGTTYNLTTGGGGGGGGGGSTPFTGGTLSTKLTTAISTSSLSGFNLLPGAAPTSPINGDMWISAGDLFTQAGGSTLPISQPARLSTLPTKGSPLQSDYLLLWDTVGSQLAKVTVSTVGISNVLRSSVTANLTVGYTFTTYNAGAIGSGTFTPAASNGNYQTVTNGGAFTIANPAADSAMDILVVNNASAGAISFSGFNVSGNTGDSLTTTNGSKFLISIRRIAGTSTYLIKALQ